MKPLSIIAMVAFLGSSWMQSAATANADPVKKQPSSRSQRWRAVPMSAPPASAPETEWYGWKVALVDGAAIAMMIAGFSRTDLDGALLAAGGWLAWTGGSPLIHRSMGNCRGATQSLALRLLPPTLLFTGLILSESTGGPTEGDFRLFAWLTLATISTGVVTLTDVLAISHRPIPAAGASSTVRWVPTLQLNQDLVTVGIGGSF